MAEEENQQIEELAVELKRLKEEGFQLKFPLDVNTQKFIKDLMFFPVVVNVSSSATVSGNYGVFFINPTARTFVVDSISEVHAVAGSGAESSLQIQRLQGIEAKGAGDDLLLTQLALNGTANTVQDGPLTNNGDLLILRKGDRLVLSESGDLTALEDVVVTVLLKLI